MTHHNKVTFKLPKVYPITDRHLSGLSHADQVVRLIDGGATLIQLREKKDPASEFYRDAEAALTIAREHNVRLIINDRVDIALALAADGVHLGQSDISPEAARRLLGASRIIGLSTHNVEQARRALKSPIDYLAFGPVFETATKPDHEPVAGLEALQSVREVINRLPLVAIGGIAHKNIDEVFAAGAQSVAVVGALLSNPAQISENLAQMMAGAGY